MKRVLLAILFSSLIGLGYGQSPSTGQNYIMESVTPFYKGDTC